MSAAPEVYVGPAFVGWRAWRILPFERPGEPVSLRLCACGTNGVPKVWQPRQATRAICGKFKTTHEAPWPGCECGIYAYRARNAAEEHFATFRDADNNSDGVLGWAFGRVSLWGRIVECEHGWRAEHAYPYAVSIYAEADVTAKVRDLYGIDVEQHPPYNLGDTEERPEPEVPADELSTLVSDLHNIKAELGEICDAVKRAERRGLLRERTWSQLRAGSARIHIGNVLHDLRDLTSIAEIREDVAGDIDELLEDLAEIVPELQRINRSLGTAVVPPADADAVSLAMAHAGVPRLGLDDDEEIVAAVGEAARQWRERRVKQGQEADLRSCGASAVCVASVLIGQTIANSGAVRPVRGDVIRVGQRLGQLAREGRLTLVSKTYEHRKYAAGEAEGS